jgi:hypothetical protein
MLARKEKLVWCLDDLEEQPIDWLWPGRLPVGKLMLIDGDPSQGKSLLTLDVASRLTTARPLPDGYTPPEPLSVVLVGSEDGIRDTVLPRLRAAGADLRRVHVFAGRARGGVWSGLPTFPEDCDLLAETLRETGARLVVVDPLLAFLSSRLCTANDQMARQALDPLARVAEEMQAAMLLVRHLTKRSRGERALYRGSGSIAFIGAARMAYLVGPAPTDEDLHVLACTKCNLAVSPSSLGFRIAGGDEGPPVVSWVGEVEVSADDLVLSAGLVRGQALTRARAFVEEQLRNGPCASEELGRRAREAGIAPITLRRAKQDLGIVLKQECVDGRNRWYCRLRDPEPAESPRSWHERREREIEQGQKEIDERMEWIRRTYGHEDPPEAPTPAPEIMPQSQDGPVHG